MWCYTLCCLVLFYLVLIVLQIKCALKSRLLYKKKSLRAANNCSLKSGVPSCNLLIIRKNVETLYTSRDNLVSKNLGPLIFEWIGMTPDWHHNVLILFCRIGSYVCLCSISTILKDAWLWLKLWHFGLWRQRCYSRISCNKRVNEEIMLLIIRDEHRSVSIRF